MKFKTFIVSLVVVFFLFSVADAGVGVGLNFKGGLNLAKQRGDYIDDAEKEGYDIGMNPGANAGVGVGIKIIDYFSIQPEILFSMTSPL